MRDVNTANVFRLDQRLHYRVSEMKDRKFRLFLSNHAGMLNLEKQYFKIEATKR